MKFEYKSVTGTIAIDVDEEWVAILEDLDRQEYNNDHRETRRHYHLEACEYEGDTFAAVDPDFERFVESEAAKAAITPALAKLNERHRRLIDALFFRGLSAKDYAASVGLSEAAVSRTKATALRKLKKILENR